MSISRAYLILIALLVLTFGLSFSPLGHWNEVFAWGFALAKAVVILTVFMHFRREGEYSKIYFVLGLLTIVLLLVGMMDDILFR